jgi:hypothetical protein
VGEALFSRIEDETERELKGKGGKRNIAKCQLGKQQHLVKIQQLIVNSFR